MKQDDLKKAARVLNAFHVFEAALTVGRHWKDQDGVNMAYLDALGEAVELYDQEGQPLPFVTDTTPGLEPPSIRAARAAIELWERKGQCPSLSSAAHACVWTCFECHRSVSANRDSLGRAWPVRCPLLNEKRCDWCDPSFGCFANPSQCQKLGATTLREPGEGGSCT